MARGDQLARQWRIIQTLISSRQGKSVSDLAQDLSCHTRTVYRDLEALQAAGFPVYTDRVEGKNVWSLLETAKHSIPIPFSLPELMALYFSRGMMGVLKDTVFYDSLISLFDKIKTTLPGEYIEYLNQIEKSLAVRSKPFKQYGQLRSIIDQVSSAAIQKKFVEIDYYTMSRKKKTRRRVAPYKIWFFDGTFYLIGNCGLRENIRIFAMDRIRNLELTDENFEMPEDFNVDEFMKSSFGVFHGEPVRVRVWFAADSAEYIREKIWHETQIIEPQPDGSIIFEAEVAGIAEIKFWIMKWGANARVIEPEPLRAAIRAEAELMVGSYTDPIS
ncbi:Transcriptional regulator, YafY family [Olavius sp. associated proteobacterium Delta 1]|nr:Transcriptional regulator, YafY family [Olavius sp. associated proteobacterium Delta 1]